MFKCGERVFGSEVKYGGISDLLSRETFYSGDKSQGMGVAGKY